MQAPVATNPSLGQKTLTKDDVVAGMVAVLGGHLVVADRQKALAAALLTLTSPQMLDSPKASAAITNTIASWLLEESVQVADMAETRGYFARGRYLRELSYRARYAVNASRRLGTAALSGNTDGALRRERVYLEGHRRVSAHREAAFGSLDAAMVSWGKVLSWRSTLSDSTTPDCRAAHGKNFDATNPPAIGLPGLVHALCQCSAGPPRAGAPQI